MPSHSSNDSVLGRGSITPRTARPFPSRRSRVEISWLGHACVRVRTRRAAAVMDPADRSSGFAMGRPPPAS